MRIFTAVPLPESVKKRVGEITRGKLPVPYVNTTNLHITLNFFGELDTDQVVCIKEIFPQVTEARKPFLIVFDKLAKFHHQLHLTLKPNPELSQLQKDLEAEFVKAGFSLHTREYYPHVTLARLNMDNVMNKQRKTDNFPNEELKHLNFEAEKVVLYESKLLLHHAHHIPIMEVNLNS